MRVELISSVMTAPVRLAPMHPPPLLPLPSIPHTHAIMATTDLTTHRHTFGAHHSHWENGSHWCYFLGTLRWCFAFKIPPFLHHPVHPPTSNCFAQSFSWIIFLIKALFMETSSDDFHHLLSCFTAASFGICLNPQFHSRFVTLPPLTFFYA